MLQQGLYQYPISYHPLPPLEYRRKGNRNRVRGIAAILRRNKYITPASSMPYHHRQIQRINPKVK